MTRERQVEILMKDGCSKLEAEKYLNRNGVAIFAADDFEENFEQYMEDWGVEEDDLLAYRDMIDKKIPVTDWSVVSDNDSTYYIMYEN